MMVLGFYRSNYNSRIQELENFLKEKEVTHYYAFSDRKASFAESVNKIQIII